MDLFEGLTALSTLVLNDNGMASPHVDLFASLTALTSLNLSNNGIALPHVDLFDGLTALTVLNLSNNGIASPHVDLFDGITALTSLVLNDNGIASPHVDLFAGLTALTSLNLSNNGIALPHVDLFDGITGLLRLYLNDNRFSTLDVNLFDGLVALRTLDLSSNSLTGLTAGVFEDLDVDMKSLYLRSNLLASLPANIFTGLTGLLDLDLSCNRLTALDPARVTPFASTLTFLEISGNSFTTPPTATGLALTNPDLNLYTGENTLCGPPDDTGTSEVSISPGSPPTGAGTAMVAHDVSATTITITARDPNAEIVPYPANFEPLYDDDPSTPGWQVKLPSHRNGFQWQVRAKNGFNTEIGSLVVYRDHPLASEARLRNLALSGVTLAKPFDNGDLTYTATAAPDATETTVTATPFDPDATTVIKLNGVEDADGTVGLELGGNIITVEVTAEDRTTIQTYTVTITIQATISFQSEEHYVSEGDSVEVTMVLSHARPGNVTITFDLWTTDFNSTPEDYTPLPESITFGPNETRASFTITATQDTEPEPDEQVEVFFTLPTGVEEVEYLIYGDHPTTIVTIVGDDTPGMTITPRTLDVDEGGDATYTVKLNGPPTENVTVDITSDDTGAAMVSPDTLTFTSQNWATPKTVTVTAGEDSDMNDEIVTLSNNPSGAEYDIVSTVDLKLNVADNDNPGVNISKQTLTIEEGSTDTYTVELNTQPSGDVTVAISSNNTDVTASASQLTFTTTTWSIEQTVTVTAGQDDDAANDMATLTHNPSGADYGSVSNASLTVTVTDNDSPGVKVSPTSLTIEEGSTDTYTVELNTQPSGDVTVAISSNNTDVTASASQLTFTTTTWSIEQTVTVTAGQDDDAATDTATLTHTASGGEYASVTKNLLVIVTDNDTPGMTVTPSTLDVDEGGDATYTVKLATQPAGEVTVTISGHAGTDLSLDKTSLTFMPTDWNTPQTVTVTAGNDADTADDTVTLTHSATSTDSDYNLITIVDVTVTDNDTPGMTVMPSTLYVGEGATATYTVKLDTAPTGNVTVAITSNDTEAATVSPASLTFMPTDWNTPQTVTVTGVQDDDRDDEESVTLSNNPSGAEYDSVDTVSVDLRVGDNDLASVSVSKTALTVGEEDTTGGSYTVALIAQPTANVTVTVAGHSGTNVTPSPITLTFTSENWATAQTVTVKAGNDADTADDTVTLTHSAASTDIGYNSINIASVEVTVTDNATANIVLGKTSLTVAEGDAAGSSYTVKLVTQPSDTVIVTISGHDGTDLSLDKTTLTFTTDNWATPQPVTVKAANDADTDGDTVTLTHSAASTDSNYNRITIASVVVTVTDNDPPLSSEARLRNLALSGVTLAKPFDNGTQSYTATAATDATETTVTATLFDPTNATTVIKLNGVEDADGTVGLELGGNIITVEVTAEDGTMKTYTVTVTIEATISFQSEEYYVSEGDSVEVTMVLSHARPGNATITFQLSAYPLFDFNPPPDDYTPLPVSITFGANQTSASFTITATQDTELEPDERVEVSFDLPSGEEEVEYLIYGDHPTTIVTIVGDDTPGMTITPRTLDVDEGGTTMYTVKLNGLPTENVTVTIASNNPGAATVSPASLTFTSQNWATAQTVTVTGVEDSDMNDEIVTLSNDPSGEEYYNISTVYVKLNVADNDSSGVSVSTTALTVREEDTTGDSYTLVRFTLPLANVTVTVAGHSGTDVTPSPTTLTFTVDNWETLPRR